MAIPMWRRDPWMFGAVETIPVGDGWMNVIKEKGPYLGWTSGIYSTKEQAEDSLKFRNGKKLVDKVEANRLPSIEIPKEEPPPGVDFQEVAEEAERIARNAEQGIT